MPAVSWARPLSTCCRWVASWAAVWNGSVTARTPSTEPAPARALLIAARWASVNAEPSAVWNTTVPDPPLAAGNAARSWSVTWAVAVPGIETADERVP